MNLSFLVLILLMLFPQILPLQAEDQTVRVLVLTEAKKEYSLGTYLEILRDTSGELTIEDVNSTAIQSQFISSQVEIPNFGYQDAPYWVRFRVRNQTASSQDWVLVLGFRNMHYMDLYVPEPDNGTYSVVNSGVLRAREDRHLPFDKLSFDLIIPPGTEQTIYIRLQSKATMTLPFTLVSPEVYYDHVMVNQLSSGAFYGSLIILVAYNIILYALIREKVYLHLGLFGLAALSFYLFFHATIFRLFPAFPPGLAVPLMVVWLGFFILTLVKFVDSYLALKEALPSVHLVAKILMYVCLFTALASLFIEYQVISTIQVIIVIIVLPAIFGLTLFLAWRGDRAAKRLLWSLPVFLIGAILTGLVRLGILASNSITEELTRIGLIWLVVFWSLALADRMNTLKKESETSRYQIMQNERRMVQYMDSLPIGVLVYDGDAKLRYMNRQSKMILHQPGIETPSDHFGHRQLEETIDPSNFSIPDSDYPHPIEQLTIRHVTQQRVSAYSEHVDINLGDTIIPVEIWSNPLVDDSGEIGGTVVAFQNIQDRLLQQDLLRKSEQIRQTILEGAYIGTFSTDLVSGEVIWDSRTREIFGVDADTPATLELGFSLIYPADRVRAQESYERAIDIGSDGIYEEEKRIIQPDGQVRWISTRGTVTFGQSAGVRQAMNLVGIVIDVTTQKQAEKELEESRIHYQNLVETMNEGLSIVDENLILTYVNPRLSEMLGYSEKDMVGQHVGRFFDQENFDLVVDQREKHIKGYGKPYTATILRSDGSKLPARIAPAMVFDEQGKLLQSIAVISDISDQVEARQLLDCRIRERKEEIASLMEVSRIVVSSLGYDDQIKKILSQLRTVIHCDGASVLLQKEDILISDTFLQKIPHVMTENLVRPFYQPEMISEQFWQDDALVFKNCRGQAQEECDFFKLTENILGSVPFEMVSWIGIPVRSRNSLIGVLSAFAAQEDFFTPAIAELMQAFANQITIVFENDRLYKQARALAAAGERNRLARELHDSVTQSLYSIRLYAEAVRSALTAGKTPAANKNLDQLISIARDGMSDLRLLIFELKPQVLEELGLLGALKKRLEMVETRAGIQAEFNVEGEPELSPDIEVQLYWVVYEALSNVLKHAKAKHVFLNFSFCDSRLTVVVQDDGVGFDHEKCNVSQSSGLKNIIDRIEGLGGSIKIDSKPGEGTSVRIVLENPVHFPINS